MDREFVINYLKTRNYWWQTREVSQADKGIIREEYLEKIEEIEGLERIISLSGIRRSGKTTILYQYIDLPMQHVNSSCRVHQRPCCTRIPQRALSEE